MVCDVVTRGQFAEQPVAYKHRERVIVPACNCHSSLLPLGPWGTVPSGGDQEAEPASKPACHRVSKLVGYAKGNRDARIRTGSGGLKKNAEKKREEGNIVHIKKQVRGEACRGLLEGRENI